MNIGNIQEIGERVVPGWQPTKQPEPVPAQRERVTEKEPVKAPERVH